MELKDRIGGFISSLNIVQKIIFYIVCIHFLPYILDVIFYLFKVEFKSQSIFKWFYISADFSELIFKPWSIFTYGFFHNQSSFSHIFWNMILFYYFGNIKVGLYLYRMTACLCKTLRGQLQHFQKYHSLLIQLFPQPFQLLFL